MTQEKIKKEADALVEKFVNHSRRPGGWTYDRELHNTNATHCAIIAVELVLEYMPTVSVSTDLGVEKYHQHELNEVLNELKSRL